MKVKKLKKRLTSIVDFKEVLKNPSPKIKVPLYTEEEVEQRNTNFGDDIVKKPTLSQRIDRLEGSIAALATEMRAGFKQVNDRIDKIEQRLDYHSQQIEQINKRLDYNGLQIEQINKRLDYNNLKDLPKQKN